jgi:hypothetical protein
MLVPVFAMLALSIYIILYSLPPPHPPLNSVTVVSCGRIFSHVVDVYFIFYLRLTLVGAPQFNVILVCITTQMAECYWSEERSPLFVGLHWRYTYNNRDREKSSGQAHLFSI